MVFDPTDTARLEFKLAGKDRHRPVAACGWLEKQTFANLADRREAAVWGMP